MREPSDGGAVRPPKLRRRGYVICGGAVLTGLATMIVAPEWFMASSWGINLVLASIAIGMVGCVIYYVDYAAYLRDWRQLQDSRGHK